MKALNAQNHPNSIFTNVIMMARAPPPPRPHFGWDALSRTSGAVHQLLKILLPSLFHLTRMSSERVLQQIQEIKKLSLA